MITNYSRFFPFLLFLCLLLSLYPLIAYGIRIDNGLRLKEMHVSTTVQFAQLNAKQGPVTVTVPSPLGTTRMSKRKVRRGSNPIHNKNWVYERNSHEGLVFFLFFSRREEGVPFRVVAVQVFLDLGIEAQHGQLRLKHTVKLNINMQWS